MLSTILRTRMYYYRYLSTKLVHSSQNSVPHLLPPCIITMFNFHEHKRVNDVLDSQLFYSKTGGYKLQLIVAANGFGAWKGTHVSVGVWYCSCISQLSIHLIQFSHTSYKDIVQTTEYNNFVLE